MPLDGSTAWSQPLGWTIRVRPVHRLVMESRHWPRAKREEFKRLAANAVFAAIDSIQSWSLNSRRDARQQLLGSWVRYNIRIDQGIRSILLTVFEFHFHGPAPSHDPSGGEQQPIASDWLVVHVVGSGRRYDIVRQRGIIPVPPKPAQNSIISPLLERRMPRRASPFAVFPAERDAASATDGKTADDQAASFPPAWSLQNSDANKNCGNGETSWTHQPAPLFERKISWPARWLRAFGLGRKHSAADLGNGHLLNSEPAAHTPAAVTGSHEGAGRSKLSRLLAWKRGREREHRSGPDDHC